METTRTKLTVEQYLAEVLALVSPVPDVFMEPYTRAAGRVLAEPVTALGPVPAFANSAMDGFAVRHTDLASGVVLREVASVPAGSATDPTIRVGECARIMTGAPLPSDADTVVPRELVTEVTGGVRIDEVVDAGCHVRHAGEDLGLGDVVLDAGRVLDARALSLVAAAGRDEVALRRRPIVNVASTGDELMAPGHALSRGQIYESNSTFLAQAAQRDGAQVLRTAVLPDDPDTFAAGLDELATHADLVVLSGGVSVGDFDVVRQVLTARADATFRHVYLQPGKPQGWARWPAASERQVPVLGLPGNPLSAAISYELFVRPLIAKMLGTAPPVDAPAIAAEGWTSPSGRRQVVPVTLVITPEGRREARPAHRRGSASHLVSALALADGLAFVPEHVTDVAPGDVLAVRSLS